MSLGYAAAMSETAVIINYLDRKFASLDADLDERFERSESRVDVKIDAVNARIDSLEEKVDGMYRNLDAYAKKADTYFQEMKLLTR